MISQAPVALYILSVILYVAQPGATQGLYGPPECAIPCISSAINAIGCSQNEFACICGPAHVEIGSLIAPCVVQQCPATLITAIESAAAALCLQYSPAKSNGVSETSIFTTTQTAPTTITTAVLSSASVAASVTPVVTSTISSAPSSPSSSFSSTAITPHTSSIFSSTSSQASADPLTVTLSPATVTLNDPSQSSNSEATSASSASNSGIGRGAIAGIAIGAAAGVAGIATLLWFIFYRRRGTGSGVTQSGGSSSEKAELEGQQETVPSELHGQDQPAELGSGGELPAELGPGGGWTDHGAESGNR